MSIAEGHFCDHAKAHMITYTLRSPKRSDLIAESHFLELPRRTVRCLKL